MKPVARSSKIGSKEIQSMRSGRLEVKRPVAQGHTRYERELPAEAVVHKQCGVAQLLLGIPAGGDNTARDNLGHGDGGGNDDLFKAFPADGVLLLPIPQTQKQTAPDTRAQTTTIVSPCSALMDGSSSRCSVKLEGILAPPTANKGVSYRRSVDGVGKLSGLEVVLLKAAGG